MKRSAVIIGIIVAALFAATAQAGGGSAALCKSWQVAQSGSGAAFASRDACVKAKEVFVPTLSSSAAHVVAGEQFTLTGSGYHGSSTGTLSFAVPGQPPYFTATVYTTADGRVGVPVAFSACADSVFPVPVTLTYTDANGVHAQTGVTLC